ncbi:MAG: hypothetical protein GWN30_14410, partial [Gammaproteobacteria bacterium]|nr:hypothetical protein [Gammaproteobacteria bacterium]NIX02755.1 hypothetical protein [Phycisphaerae bacterium]
ISISILVVALTILTFLFLPDVNLIQAGINEWTTQGPPGADITVLTIDPIITNTIYAGTFNGLYKSIDGGNSWNIIDIGAPVGSTSISILDIATAHVMSSTVIYISTSGYGVYKSIDEGLTWVNSLDIGGGINALAVDPLIPTTVYAGNAPMG